MIKLWGRANSSNVMKVIWLLQELGVPYHRVDVGGPFGGTATPSYRTMNPLGVVPTLEEDGFTLFESNAIMRYLCNTQPEPTAFYPQAARSRGQIDCWLDFQQTALNRPQSTVFQGLVRIAPEHRNHAAIATAVTEAAGIWAILDGRLGRHDYVAGDDLTLADIAFGVHMHRWFVMPIEGRPDAPHLHKWYQRLLERPAYRDHVALPLS
ncbi:MAG TPA: glutathione S-transferase family protein [Acetobacteraceae bacterium]|jgi:glutathione S-transferase